MVNYILNNILYFLYCCFQSYDQAERTYLLLNTVSQFFTKIILDIGLHKKEKGTWHVMYSKDKGSQKLLKVLLILVQFVMKNYIQVAS